MDTTTLIAEAENYGRVVSARPGDPPGPQRAFERDEEIELLVRQLERRGPKSFILVGPSGCGKTAVLRELFRRVGSRPFEPWIVLETSTSLLLAGTLYSGELETRVRGMLDTARRSPRFAVFFTDIYNMIGAGKTSKSDESIGSFLGPFVESGELTLIGECTPELYRSGVERYPPFAKLFHLLRLDEQSDEKVRKVLRHVADQIAENAVEDHGVEVYLPDKVLESVVDLGSIYFSGMSAPGGAVQLLRQVVNLRLNSKEVEQRQVAQLEFHHKDVIDTLEAFTGIPGFLLDDSQPLQIDEIRAFFEARVLGQPDAIDAVVDLITLIKAGVTDPKKPMGVFFFVGPTGVGKTELAKALAEFIFGKPDRMIRYDMSEFKDYSSFEKLIGDPQAPENSPLQAGSLVSKVRQQPFSVILLDEIEKAHPNIFDLLLQLFDDGRLTDSFGRTTNFTQTIIVMTSNLGADLARPSLGYRDDVSANVKQDVLDAMKNYFRPEFLNRIGQIVVFVPLKQDDMRKMVHRELGQVLKRHGFLRRELLVDIDPGVIELLLREGFSPLYGARPLKRAVERLALLPIARQMVRMGPETENCLLRLVPAGNHIAVKVVEDRETRRFAAVSRGVTVVDPIAHKKVRLKSPQIGERVANLRRQVDELQAQCAASGLETHRAALMQTRSRNDFWDDPQRARQLCRELYFVDHLLQAVGRVIQRTRDLEQLLAQSQAQRDPEKLKLVAERWNEVQRHLDLVRYSLQCKNPLDRCDAFLCITLVDDTAEDDVAGHLADMYANWARGKGFTVTIVNEVLLSARISKQVDLLVEGVCPYGILRTEEGIHEMVYDKSSRNERFSRFVKVRVLPIPDEADCRLAESDVVVQKLPSKGVGRRCKRYKSQVTLTHQGTLTSVRGHSDLAPAEAEKHLADLLRAELFRAQAIRSIAGGDGNAQTTEALRGFFHETVVRKYTLRPLQSAKDQRTGVSTHNLSKLWKGGLDEFLNAALSHQQPADERQDAATA
jgi:ATP-dependent Clp protease ATP-binding subunit ClpC